MSADGRRHRLDGLEPNNLLAFLALLGLLRALEEVEPAWSPKVAWMVDEFPVRPELSLSARLPPDRPRKGKRAVGIPSAAEHSQPRLPCTRGVRGHDRGHCGRRRGALSRTP